MTSARSGTETEAFRTISLGVCAVRKDERFDEIRRVQEARTKDRVLDVLGSKFFTDQAANTGETQEERLTDSGDSVCVGRPRKLNSMIADWTCLACVLVNAIAKLYQSCEISTWASVSIADMRFLTARQPKQTRLLRGVVRHDLNAFECRCDLSYLVRLQKRGEAIDAYSDVIWCIH